MRARRRNNYQRFVGSHAAKAANGTQNTPAAKPARINARRYS
jgi:hypothetical protein